MGKHGKVGWGEVQPYLAFIPADPYGMMLARMRLRVYLLAVCSKETERERLSSFKVRVVGSPGRDLTLHQFEQGVCNG